MGHRIGIFSAYFLPHLGGVEAFTSNLAHELAKEGHSVTVVTSKLPHLAEYERLNDNIEIFRMPSISILNDRLPLPIITPRYKSLTTEIESRSLDGILINTRFYPHTFLGVHIAQKCGVKPVILDHGSAYLTLGNTFLDKAIVAYEKFVTSRLQKYSIDYYGISLASCKWLRSLNIEPVGVIHNAIDAKLFRENASSRDFREELRLTSSDFLVCFTGRLIPEKGVGELCEAARLLEESGNSAVFLLAGIGPMEGALKATRPSNLHFLGKLPPEDVASLLLQSDVFCLPTRSEGFSTSMLEATACGVPSIITKVGGVEEMMPNSTFGIILEDSSPKNIAASINLLECNPSLRRTISANSQNRVETVFSWSNTASAVLNACIKNK